MISCSPGHCSSYTETYAAYTRLLQYRGIHLLPRIMVSWMSQPKSTKQFCPSTALVMREPRS